MNTLQTIDFILGERPVATPDTTLGIRRVFVKQSGASLERIV